MFINKCIDVNIMINNAINDDSSGGWNGGINTVFCDEVIHWVVWINSDTVKLGILMEVMLGVMMKVMLAFMVEVELVVV